MKKRLAISMFVILFVAAAMGGATMAWFTDEADIPGNTFVAGTVELEANDEFDFTDNIKENWNPGECVDKEVEVVYKGSKDAVLRMRITEQWSDTDNDKDGTWHDRDVPNVDWKVNGDDWNEDNEWYYHENSGWWYYVGDNGEVETTIGGETLTLSYLDGDEQPITIEILSSVCLDGNLTGNDYQDATYTIDITFQAIQASHADQWDWDDIDFDTGLIE